MLDKAFEALKTLDWGADLKPLQPIDTAIIESQKDAAVQKEVEAGLIAILKSDAPRDAKDYACRKLMIVGTAAAVPVLAEMLPQEKHSHMARFALERIPAAEAATALREGLAKTNGKLKIGVIASLGARRDAASVPALTALLTDTDESIMRAAATALGDIATTEAAKALAECKPAGAAAKSAAIDARLACAEALLAAGNKAEALAIYKSFAAGDQPKHIKLAGTRGMLAVAGKKE
jgi:HEAT repeat protein